MQLLGKHQSLWLVGSLKWAVVLTVICLASASWSTASAQTVSISGEISLPGADVAPTGGVVINVNAQSNQNDFESSSVTILEGNNSIAYTVIVADDASKTWGVYFSCNCPSGYFSDGTYSSSTDGGTTDDYQAGTNLAGDVQHANVDMTILRGVTIEGTLSLPLNQVAPAGGLSIHVWTGRSDSESRSGHQYQITEGNSSVNFVEDAATSSVDTELSYQCDSCGPYVGAAYYNGAGTVAFKTQASPLDNGVDHSGLILELLEGNALTGIVKLPGLDIADDGDIVNWVIVNAFDQNDQSIWTYSVPVKILNDASSAAYEMGFPDVPVGGSYQLRGYCSENCGDYVDSIQYLQDNGSLNLNYNLVDEFSMPSSQDFELLEASSVSGAIRLPNSEVADNGDIGSWVVLGLFDVNGQFISSHNDYVIIPAGASSVDYEINYQALTDGGSYQLESYCIFNCGSYVEENQFLQDDGSLAFEFNRVGEFNLPTQQNFELVAGLGEPLAGTISLPQGAVANDGGIFNWVQVFRYDEAGQFAGQVGRYLEIPQGQSSVDYELSHLDETQAPGSRYVVQSYCVENCGPYLTTAQFLQSDGSVSLQYFNGLSAGDIPADLDFELIEGVPFVGSVTLPNSATASEGDIGLSTQITIYDADGNYVNNYSASQTILNGGSSVDFELIYTAAPAGGSYGVYNYCQSNCGDFLQYTNTYLQPDGSTSVEGGFNARVTQIPALVEFELLVGDELTGAISLPSGSIADAGDIEVSVFITTYDSAENYLASNTIDTTIANGESSTNYAISHLSAPDGGSYAVASSCFANCGSLVASSVHLQQDGSSDFGESKIPAATLPAMANIELIEGVSIDVRTLLPMGMTADSGIQSAQTYVAISAYDENDEFYAGGTAFLSYSLGAAFSETSTIVVPELSPGAHYKIVYLCDDYFSGDCGDLISNGQGYSPSGIVTGFRNGEELTELPASIDLQLHRGTAANFELRRPGSLPDVSNYVYFEVSISAYDSADALQGVDTTLFFVNQSESLRVQDYDLLALPEGGYYKVEFYCTDEYVEFGSSDCASYLESHPSYNFEIQANAIPSPIVLQLIEKTDADSYEDDNDFSLANAINSGSTQNHTIHEAGDTDWVKFSLKQISDVSIKVVSSESDGAARVTLYESDGSTVIEDNDDILEDDELVNLQLSLINISMLPAGDYFVLVEGFSDTSTSQGYSLRYIGPDDGFCFPIVIQGGGAVLVCL